MQRGNEEYAVLVLQLVVQLTLGQERRAGTIRAQTQFLPRCWNGGRGELAALGDKDRLHQENRDPTPLSNLHEENVLQTIPPHLG
jgi:hypothetical protein